MTAAVERTVRGTCRMMPEGIARWAYGSTVCSLAVVMFYALPYLAWRLPHLCALLMRFISERVVLHFWRELMRLFLSEDPSLWMGYYASCTALLLGMWCALFAKGYAVMALARVMPLPVWTICFLAIGMAQGLAIGSQKIGNRLIVNTFAWFFWLVISSLILLVAGLTLIHVISAPLLLFLALAIIRTLRSLPEVSTDGGPTST